MSEKLSDISDTPTEPFSAFQNFRSILVSTLGARVPSLGRFALSETQTERFGSVSGVGDCETYLNSNFQGEVSGFRPKKLVGVSDLSAKIFRSLMLSVGVRPVRNFLL